MGYEFLHVEEKGADSGLTFLELVVDRPKMNALSQDLLAELGDCFDELAERELSALIITGAGRAFVAGADIKAMVAMTKAEAENFSQLGQGVFAKLEALPCVTIAAINGFALGGGCELALACDLRIASEEAQMGQPEVKLGLIPGFGGTQRLARLVGMAKAKELILIGGNLDAVECERIGLVNAVVPAEGLLSKAREWAEAIAARGPASVAAAKKVMQSGVWGDLVDAYRAEASAFGDLFEEHEATEGMLAFIERRPARFLR
ncbi:enoyl-CoA hydratase/isomerase family protein [bacterium]|nr:enoyl-CoA hydratase/isomerase family protein [bacterium]